MATKRIIQDPLKNATGQITGSSGKTYVTTNTFTPGTATSSSGGPTDDGGSYVDYNATTDQSGNVIGGSSGRVNYDSSGKVISSRMVNIPKTVSSTDKSVALLASKGGVTNGLASGKSDNLPGVTKYAGSNTQYGNNKAGIDLVNSQNELNLLSEAEKAQRLAGMYNPTPVPGTPAPTVATPNNPVIKKTLQKEEPTVPDTQGMDLPTIQENIDRLQFKVNSGKSLTEEEYVAYNKLRRQAVEMMKPQSLTGGLNNLMQTQQNEIATTQKTQEEQNARDMEAFTRSQEAFKQAQFAELDRADEEKKKTLGYILGAQGSGQGSYTVEALNKITENTAMQKQAYQDSIQAKIDLYESQQRKDSAETIQKMKDRLYSTQLKAAEFDVANLQEINKFNQEQSKSTLEKLDNLKAMSDSIIASSTPLTEEQKQQAQVIGQFLVDPDGGLNQALLESYKKTNPNLIPTALSFALAERNKIQENNLAMKGLDADIKRAQLNKLLNPAKEYEYIKDVDGNTIAVAKDNPNERINITGQQAGSTIIDTIKKREGFRDKAYQDSTGTWTIGYGFTNVNGQPVKPGMTMDRGTADDMLQDEIGKRQNYMSYITVPLNESQKAALSSFEFNLGSGIREKNAMPILNKINQGDLKGAGELMKQYSYSKGQKLQGLENRRNEEARLLLAKDTQNTQQYKTDKDATKEITGLRKEFNALPEVKNYKQVVTSYKTIEEQAKKATPAGDLSMIFAYMKLLDPTSTVREGEFANAQNAASIPDQVKNAYNKAAQGTRLNDKQRQDFLNGAKVQLQSYEDLHNQALDNYRTYITAGGNPADIGEYGDVTGRLTANTTQKALQAGGGTQPTVNADPLGLGI